MSDWQIFLGTPDKPHDGISQLPEPPGWRKFGRRFSEDSFDFVTLPQTQDELTADKGSTFRIPQSSTDSTSQPSIVDVVNAALYLRRPLMVTGRPGTGKTSLAYAIAHELKLGPVLLWPITARATLKDGLYRYDAISRLQDAQVAANSSSDKNGGNKVDAAFLNENVGQYVQLGPVGTAFLPTKRPRVLLIDEVDKSDINLPNDLLNLFEEGEYEIPELSRLKREENAPDQKTTVRTFDRNGRATITNGFVRCYEFPLILLTSNGERDFPPAFLRRCLRLNIADPDEEALIEIVKAHFKDRLDVLQKAESVIQDFIKRREKGSVASDQLLNAIYLISGNKSPNPDEQDKLINLLLKSLTSGADQ
ncbi:MAG: MoxR family ATPase [Cyanobacteria bacterium P01_F01_bin.150]